MWILGLRGLTRLQWLLKVANNVVPYVLLIKFGYLRVVYPDLNLPRYAITMHFEY